ncbi:cell wall assembly protein [Bacillus anthracis]|nr:cell wall assembly protein [Bacillus anthracis]
MDEVIVEVLSGLIVIFVVGVTADAIGNLVSGKDEEKETL